MRLATWGRAVVLACAVCSSSAMALSADMGGDNQRQAEEYSNPCRVGDESCERAMARAMGQYALNSKRASEQGSAWNLLWLAAGIYGIYKFLSRKS